MEQRMFSIAALVDTTELRTAQRYAMEAAASRVLRAARVELSVDEPRSGFGVLVDMEDVLTKTNPNELGDAKATILGIIADIMPPTNTYQSK